MYENPYQPPAAPLTESPAGASPPPKRFRFRIIPATLCFFFGGSFVIAGVVQTGLVVWLAAEFGISRINFGTLAPMMGEWVLFTASILLSGWFWLKGNWRWAVASIVLAVGAGLALQVTMGRGKPGDDSIRVFLNHVLKPP